MSVSSVVVMAGMGHEEETDVMECKDQWAQRGLTGKNGPPGASGAFGPKSGGVVSTRWGKHTCRDGANLVYAGVMAGSHYHQAGGGTTRLCMPNNPDYTLPFINGVQNYSPLYNVEYQNTIRNHAHDIPCAVCVVPTKNLVLMVPGKSSCPAGFHERVLWLPHVGEGTYCS